MILPRAKPSSGDISLVFETSFSEVDFNSTGSVLVWATF